MISLPLEKERQRPVVELYGMQALIDTGAVIPMVSMPAKAVEKMFSAVKVKGNVSLGGIGGRSAGDIYAIPLFSIGEIKYEPFEVFVPYVSKITFPILLSSTLFYGMSYTVDTVEGKFIIDTKNALLKRKFRIKDLHGELYPQIDDTLIQDGSMLVEDLAIYSNFSIA